MKNPIFNIGADYSCRYRLQPIILIIGPITRMADVSVQLYRDENFWKHSALIRCVNLFYQTFGNFSVFSLAKKIWKPVDKEIEPTFGFRTENRILINIHTRNSSNSNKSTRQLLWLEVYLNLVIQSSISKISANFITHDVKTWHTYFINEVTSRLLGGLQISNTSGLSLTIRLHANVWCQKSSISYRHQWCK